MIEENPIIEEIRQTRVKMLAEHHDDLDLLVSELQRLSEERARAGRPTVSPAARVNTFPTKKVG